jgi:SOS-response transcriptional repressor LexA
MNQNRPSKKQQILLSFIDGFIKGNGYGPSYREIMRALDYKSVSTVAIHVDGLIAKGLLAKKDNSARSLEVVNIAPTPPVPQQLSSKEKWLADEITKRLQALKNNHTEKKVEDLYVLIGTLKILGFAESHQLHQTSLDTYLKTRSAA